MSWVEKLVDGKLQNQAGLPEEQLEILAEDFAILEKQWPGLAGRILRYVIDNDGAAVLSELPKHNSCGSVLRLECTYQGGVDDYRPPRLRLLPKLSFREPQFLIRLGKVYEAASRPTRHPAFLLPDAQHAVFEVLLNELLQARSNYRRKEICCGAVTTEVLEGLLVEEGVQADLLARTAFLPCPAYYYHNSILPLFYAIDGFPEYLLRHKATLLQTMQEGEIKARLHALESLYLSKLPIEAFLEPMVSMATEKSKQVRDKATVLLEPVRGLAIPLLEKIFESSSDSDERVNAANLLWRWDEENRRPWFKARLDTEKSKKVAKAISDLIAVPEVAAPAASASLVLPPLPPVEVSAPLGPETLEALKGCVPEVNKAINANFNQGRTFGQSKPRQISPQDVEQAFEMLQSCVFGKGSGGGPRELNADQVLASVDYTDAVWRNWRQFLQRPELQLIHAVRFLYLIGSLHPHAQTDQFFGWQFESILDVYRKTHPRFGLRELGTVFQALGLDPSIIGYRSIYAYGWERPFRWEPELVWPYFAENVEMLLKPFQTKEGYFYKEHRRQVFRILSYFPQPPPECVPMLWEMALGPKLDRPEAQRCLENASDKVPRLIAALSNGKAEIRAAAAEWLTRLRDPAAQEPLFAALRKEKNETTQGALMTALEALGVPIEQFLDRDNLKAEAEKGLAKGVPEALQWFPFSNLPTVHWADNGKVVEPVILKWFLVQNYKLKNPEPGPLLRRYCGSFKKSEREALGQFVVEAWIAEDIAPIPQAEAERLAQQNAQQLHAWNTQYSQLVQQNPHLASTAPPQKTLEEYLAQALTQFLKQPKGSAIDTKGILAVGGACCGAGVAPLAARYLKEWYGMRGAQCRALLQMLAWVEHPSATQLLLAVGNRFRTKGIQEEANKQAQALADRKGWSLDELADRTIPSAGFDENGVMELDYGPRKFTAQIKEGFQISVTNEEGKTIASLPEPRQTDDAERTAAAKKALSTAKKELKSVSQMQKERLYEAMCTQRSWRFEDWDLYLNRHPIVRYYCQRVVWSLVRDGKTIGTFRAMADGSLTNPEDDAVTAHPNDLVRLAHDCNTPKEVGQAWQQHFADYKVEPLFEQFGKPSFVLSDDKSGETELADFQGHVLESFKLRGRATKLGYTRGQAEDGGWFYTYNKRFPTLGLEATLEFTGNSLPEENRTVALRTLAFHQVSPDQMAGGNRSNLALSEIPSVLLSETWNDLRLIAAEGPGFDPEWEKKSQY